jgi:hypothetical protein
MNALPELSRKSLFLFALLAIAASGSLHGQRGGPPAGPPPTPKLVAPIDVTGQWVSIISEDWRYRIAAPPKGDYTGIPLNGAARRVADAWDPARDEAAGDQCKAYGVGGVMRLPTRMRISWIDEQTLKLETDAGTQTRTIGFGASKSPGGDWQGSSIAAWDRSAPAIGGFLPVVGGRGGSLKVVTTKMKSGYLRRNGVPYSADAVVTEYFDRFDVPNGDSLLVVSTEIVDPAYLAQPFWTSTHFRKQADAAGWSPTPCVAR